MINISVAPLASYWGNTEPFYYRREFNPTDSIPKFLGGPITQYTYNYTGGSGENEYKLSWKDDSVNDIARKYRKTIERDDPEGLIYVLGGSKDGRASEHMIIGYYSDDGINNLPADYLNTTYNLLSLHGKTIGFGQTVNSTDDHGGWGEDWTLYERIFAGGLVIATFIGLLDVGTGINNIGAGFCYGQKNLPYVQINTGDNRIEAGRFINVIEDCAFENCEALINFGFIYGTDYYSFLTNRIGNYAFANTSIDANNIKWQNPNKIQIGDYAFQCSNTSQINQWFKPDVTKGCYKGCKNFKNSPTWIDNTKKIGDEGFEASGLTKLETPTTLTHMGRRAFANCNNLTNIKLNEGLISIGPEAFKLDKTERKNLEGYSITIPKTVKYIHSEAFKNRTNLTTITFEEGRSEPLYIGWDAFYNTGITNLILPHDTIVLGQGFVHSCPNLESVSFRAREESEMDNENQEEYKYTTYIGNWAFEGCNELTTIDFTNKGNNWKWAANFGLAESYAVGVNIDDDGYGQKFEAYSNNTSGRGGGRHLYNHTNSIQTLKGPWELMAYSSSTIPTALQTIEIYGSSQKSGTSVINRESIDLAKELNQCKDSIKEIVVNHDSNITKINIIEKQPAYGAQLIKFFVKGDTENHNKYVDAMDELTSSYSMLIVGDMVTLNLTEDVTEGALGFGLNNYDEIWIHEFSNSDKIYTCQQLFNNLSSPVVQILHYKALTHQLPAQFAHNLSTLKYLYITENIFEIGEQAFEGASALLGIYEYDKGDSNNNYKPVLTNIDRLIIRKNAFRASNNISLGNADDNGYRYIPAGKFGPNPILLYWQPDISESNDVWGLTGFYDFDYITAIAEGAITLTANNTEIIIPFLGGCYYPQRDDYRGYCTSLNFMLCEDSRDGKNQLETISIVQYTDYSDLSKFTALLGTQTECALNGVNKETFKNLYYYGGMNSTIEDLENNCVFPSNVEMQDGIIAFIDCNMIPSSLTADAKLKVKQIDIIVRDNYFVEQTCICQPGCFYNITNDHLYLTLPSRIIVGVGETGSKSWFDFLNKKVQIDVLKFASAPNVAQLEWNAPDNVPYAYTRQVKFGNDFAPSTVTINSRIVPYAFYNQRFLNEIVFDTGSEGLDSNNVLFGQESALVRLKGSDDNLRATIQAQLDYEKISDKNWITTIADQTTYIQLLQE